MWLNDIGIPIIIELFKNVTLLLALTFLYGLTNFDADSTLSKRIISGIIIGACSVLIMSQPWEVREGLIFDTRSVLLVSTGAFFGFIPTLIAVVMSLTYRIFFVGSYGVYAGVFTIISTATLGLSWHRIRAKLPKLKPHTEYYLLGLIAHIITMLCFLAIPWPTAFEVMLNVSLPFLGVFPFVTMGLMLTLNNQRTRINHEKEVINQKVLLQASIDSAKEMEIFALNLNFEYISFNRFHEESMEKYYNKHIEIGQRFIDYVEHPMMKNRIQNVLQMAFKGKSINRVVEIETNKGKFVEEMYSPIFKNDHEVIGVSIFSQDISERKHYEDSILYISYHDPLTNLYNRRYYQEEVAKLSHPEYYPLALISVDINGLKMINDAFGHAAGDELLCKVADALKQSFETERIARIGGDEFIIILPNCNQEELHKITTKAFASFGQKTIYGMNVSVSYGTAIKEDETPMDEILKVAEDHMYSNKLYELSSHRSEIIKTILNTLHEKNPREEKHSERVSRICTYIGEALGMSPNEINLLKTISNLHDIGKIAIDDAILNKPGKLTDQEWEIIKKHPEIGYRILSSSPEYSEIAQDILSHHERYDGKGYPRGLVGDEIPLRARIITLADSYDAMTSDRPYRKALTHEEAIDEIKRCSGTQFDPKIVDILLNHLKNA